MFKLVIKSSKDISSLSINFADGTSTVTSNKVEKTHSEQKNNISVQKDVPGPRSRKEQFLDTDADYSSVQQEVVQLPKINVVDRPVNVAPELQNLDF